MNNTVPPQFTEGPVNAEFSGVLQVNSLEELQNEVSPNSMKFGVVTAIKLYDHG